VAMTYGPDGEKAQPELYQLVNRKEVHQEMMLIEANHIFLIKLSQENGGDGELPAEGQRFFVRKIHPLPEVK